MEEQAAKTFLDIESRLRGSLSLKGSGNGMASTGEQPIADPSCDLGGES